MVRRDKGFLLTKRRSTGENAKHELTKNWLSGRVCDFRACCDYPHRASLHSFCRSDRRSNHPDGRELGVSHRVRRALLLDVATLVGDGIETDEYLVLAATRK